MITKEQRDKEKLLRYKDAVSDLIEGLETSQITQEHSAHTQLTPQKREFIKNILLKKSAGIGEKLASMDSNLDSYGHSPLSGSSSSANNFDNTGEEDEPLPSQQPNKRSLTLK